MKLLFLVPALAALSSPAFAHPGAHLNPHVSDSPAALIAGLLVIALAAGLALVKSRARG